MEALLARFRVEAFPTLVVARTDGTVLARLEGYPDRRARWRFLNQASASTKK